MYSSWTSLQSYLLPESSTASILKRFPEATGKDVVSAVVSRCLAQNLAGAGQAVTAGEQPSRLISEHDVSWAMEVVCYGLCLPYSEHDLVRDCISVYCEWLSALSAPRLSVPRAVVESPGQFCSRMFYHLYNAFVPRAGATADHVKRQAVLCHRVLRTVQAHVRESRSMTRELWEPLLRVLLAIADTLVAPPRDKDSLGDQLSERVIAVLFEMWLLACATHFPVPSLWRTFRDMCGNWRHHEALVNQWNRVNFALAAHLIHQLYGRREVSLELAHVDDQGACAELARDYVAPLDRQRLVQCWFRFLHVLGNPAELCSVDLICSTPKFKHYALASSQVIEPSQHECLAQLPRIFLRAVKGIAALVETFLDGGRGSSSSSSSSSCFAAPQQQTAATPSLHQQHLSASHASRRFTICQSDPSSLSSFHGPTPPASPSGSSGCCSRGSDRPSCNSLLHVFGVWLFDAALGGAGRRRRHQQRQRASPAFAAEATQLAEHDGSASTGAAAAASGSSSSSSSPLQGDAPGALSFSLGRAEACAALCRIVRSLRTGETIEPVYLARIYLVLYEALEVPATSWSAAAGVSAAAATAAAAAVPADVLTYCLCNMDGLFCLDLAGVNALLPRLVAALEAVMPGGSIGGSPHSALRPHERVNSTDLRRAAGRLLLAILCLPLHYGSLDVVDLLSGRPVCTYESLRLRLARLTLGSLRVEADAGCTTALLAAAALLVHDTAAYESRSEDEADGRFGGRRRALVATASSAADDGAGIAADSGSDTPDGGSSGDDGSSSSCSDGSTSVADMAHQAAPASSSGSGRSVPPSGSRSSRVGSEASSSLRGAGGGGSSEDTGTATAVADETSGILPPSRPPRPPPLGYPPAASTAAGTVAGTIASASDVSSASACSLFCAAVSVVTSRLNAQWRMDLGITLCALDVLTSLSKARTIGGGCRDVDVDRGCCDDDPVAEACGRVVQSLCDLVAYLCSRPPKNQLRDLHSVIVAALLCLCSWLTEHPEVLQRRDCLRSVLEVVELGISGRKSVQLSAAAVGGSASAAAAASTVELKGDKMHMPVSQRVRDAAEVVLESIMDQADAFPCPCGPDSLYSTIGERELLLLPQMPRDDRPQVASRGFKYFALGSLVIVGILEDFAVRAAAELPQVKVVVRGPFGRQAWCVQLKLRPAAAAASATGGDDALDGGDLQQRVARPPPLRNPGVSHPDVKQRYFPATTGDGAAAQLSARVESCLPTMEQVIAESRDASERMTSLLRSQSAFEHKMAGKSASAASAEVGATAGRRQPIGVVSQECHPKPPASTLQAARMVLSQLGLLSTDAALSCSVGGVSSSGGSAGSTAAVSAAEPPSQHLAALATRGRPSFVAELDQLDRLPNRTHDTAFVYYVRSGQRSARDILANVLSKRHVDGGFLEFLGSLGWPVRVDRHDGWTGEIGSTGWAAQPPPSVSTAVAAADAPGGRIGTERIPSDTGGSAYDGRRWLLYWADCRSEVAFIVPSSSEHNGARERYATAADDQSSHSASHAPAVAVTEQTARSGSTSGASSAIRSHAAAAAAATAAAAAATTAATAAHAAHVHSDLRVAIVWLERFEDHESFPLYELLPAEHAQAAAASRFAKQSHATAAAPPRDCLVVYVHALRSGLLRVHLLSGSGASVSACLPLADGMLVSQRALGTLVRQAVINAGNRRRLESDLSQVPHNRRNAKIQEIVNKYRAPHQSEHELLADLFAAPADD